MALYSRVVTLRVQRDTSQGQLAELLGNVSALNASSPARTRYKNLWECVLGGLIVKKLEGFWRVALVDP